jgi:hypothetical protein
VGNISPMMVHVLLTHQANNWPRSPTFDVQCSTLADVVDFAE